MRIPTSELFHSEHYYVDADTGDLRVLVPIMTGTTIGRDNTCKTAFELKNYFLDEKQSIKKILEAYRNSLKTDLAFKKEPGKEKRVLQANRYLEILEQVTPTIMRHFQENSYPNYPESLYELINRSNNLLSMHLRPATFGMLMTPSPVFSVSRNPDFQAQLFISLKTIKQETVLQFSASVDVLDTKKQCVDEIEDSLSENKTPGFDEIKSAIEKVFQTRYQLSIAVTFHIGDRSIDEPYLLRDLIGLDESELATADLRTKIDGLISYSDMTRSLLENNKPALAPFDDFADKATHLFLSKDFYETLFILLQFYLAEINLYCHAHNKFSVTTNFGRYIDDDNHFSESLCAVVVSAFVNRHRVEYAIIDFINEHAVALHLTSPIDATEAKAIVARFHDDYTQVADTPHRDDFLLFYPEITGAFFCHRAMIYCQFDTFMVAYYEKMGMTYSPVLSDKPLDFSKKFQPESDIDLTEEELVRCAHGALKNAEFDPLKVLLLNRLLPCARLESMRAHADTKISFLGFCNAVLQDAKCVSKLLLMLAEDAEHDESRHAVQLIGKTVRFDGVLGLFTADRNNLYHFLYSASKSVSLAELFGKSATDQEKIATYIKKIQPDFFVTFAKKSPIGFFNFIKSTVIPPVLLAIVRTVLSDLGDSTKTQSDSFLRKFLRIEYAFYALFSLFPKEERRKLFDQLKRMLLHTAILFNGFCDSVDLFSASEFTELLLQDDGWMYRDALYCLNTISRLDQNDRVTTTEKYFDFHIVNLSRFNGYMNSSLFFAIFSLLPTEKIAEKLNTLSLVQINAVFNSEKLNIFFVNAHDPRVNVTSVERVAFPHYPAVMQLVAQRMRQLIGPEKALVMTNHSVLTETLCTVVNKQSSVKESCYQAMQNGYEFACVLSALPETQRFEFYLKVSNVYSVIRNGYELVNIMALFSLEERFKILWMEGTTACNDALQLQKILESFDLIDRVEALTIILIEKGYFLLKSLNEEGAVEKLPSLFAETMKETILAYIHFLLSDRSVQKFVFALRTSQHPLEFLSLFNRELLLLVFEDAGTLRKFMASNVDIAIKHICLVRLESEKILQPLLRQIWKAHKNKGGKNRFFGCSSNEAERLYRALQAIDKNEGLSIEARLDMKLRAIRKGCGTTKTAFSDELKVVFSSVMPGEAFFVFPNEVRNVVHLSQFV